MTHGILAHLTGPGIEPADHALLNPRVPDVALRILREAMRLAVGRHFELAHPTRARIETAEPELIISDVMMETATEGYAVSGAVKMHEMLGDGRIPLIMVSSIESSPDDLFPRSEELGVIRPDYYLTKPLDIPRFLEIVKKIAHRIPA